MITIDYRCADGTPFPVTFETEGAAAQTWRLDREHSADPRTPLDVALMRLALPETERAYGEVGLPVPGAFAATPGAMGFPYSPTEFMSQDEMVQMINGCVALVEKWGGALRIWHDLCLPKTKASLAFLDAAGDDVPVAELAGAERYGQQMTMVPAFICFGDLESIKGVIAPLYGERADIVAYELTQGYDNTTLLADQALWELGRVALEHDAVMAAFGATDPASAMRSLRASGKATAFFDAVDSFLAAYGARAEAWDIALPTWNEQGNGFWAALSQLADPAAPAPTDAIAKAAARREQLAEDIRAQLADDANALGRFHRRLERVCSYVAVREERALWQVALTGSLRHAVLRRGARLVEQGMLDDACDVFYLLPDEVERPPADARSIAARRRSEHERWKHVVPPVVIGGETPHQELPTVPVLPDDGIVRGVAASRGLATGTARVITDLADADRLEPGDVLVCIMTAPPWTPLFGIAAAIVADTGDLGSHPGIAAREYGIPCVLGTKIATSVIPDGALVTVDGESGTVSLVC